MAAGTLYLGDNLDVLRDGECIPTESVDLIYLDPPFNSNRNYNMLFAEHDMSTSKAQLRAFEDTWTWDSVAQATYEVLTTQNTTVPAVANIIEAFCRAFPRSDMAAYLVMMSLRLIELRRVLKPTGSLYLHCDPTASHYVKLVLDAIFGQANFRNEIAWQRSGAKNDPKRFGRSHDVIFFYTASNSFTWNVQHTPFQDYSVVKNYTAVEPETGRRFRLSDLTANKAGGDTDYEWKGMKPYTGRHWAFSKEKMQQLEEQGRIVYRRTGMPVYKRYLDEMPGVPLQDVWTDIRLTSADKERLGYPTQKPIALLERIITASSNEGDVVLDPFCGCGTTIHAAQRLKRKWIGIDVTFLAIRVIERRLKMSFPDLEYAFDGFPKDTEGAHALAERSPHNFQEWAVHVLGAEQTGGRRAKRGGDSGIDGTLRFATAPGIVETAIIQVTGEKNVGPKKVRDLAGTLLQEKAAMGVLFTAYPATRGMKDAAAAAGAASFEGWNRRYPKIQLVSADEWFQGKKVEFPGRILTAPEIEPPGSRPGENLILKGIEAPPPPARRAAIVKLAKEPEADAPKRALPSRPQRKRARADVDKG